MATMVTCHRIDGSSAQMWSVDAKEACRRHPNEWSMQPFSEAQRKKWQDEQDKAQAARAKAS